MRNFNPAVVGWVPEPLSRGDYRDYVIKEADSNTWISGICRQRGENMELPSQWLLDIAVVDLDASPARQLALNAAARSSPTSRERRAATAPSTSRIRQARTLRWASGAAATPDRSFVLISPYADPSRIVINLGYGALDRARGRITEVAQVTQERQFRELLDGVLTGRVSRREMMQRAAALGLGASAVSTLSLAQLGVPIARAQDATPVATPEAEATPGGVLRMAMQSDPSALDPQTLSLTAIWHVVEHIYETLMRIQPDLTVTPSLAESVDISEDGLVYTFNLRQGVTFHDGTPFTADDVLFTYTRLLDPATGSQSTTDLLSVDGAAAFTAGDTTELTGIRVVDDHTLEITLEAPDASFLTSLSASSTSIYSRAFVEANNNDVSQVANGTGPFMLDEYIPATSLTYSKNPNYWDTGLPYLDGLEMVIASEDTARTGALVQGSVDFIEYAPLRDVDSLAANSELKIAGDSNTNIRFLGFNLTREPFTNQQVRQAISMVVDRGPIIEAAVFGKGTAVATIFPPDFWAALPVEPTAPDIAGAQALMAEAGFADGFDTTITSWAEYSFLSDAAVVLQEQLRAININAELNLVDTGTMGQMVYADRDFDLAVTGTSAYVDPHGLILENFGTGNSGNFVSYSNPEVDELILAGQTETETEARAEIYRQIQEILLQDLPWVNFFVANQFEAMKQTVMGYDHIATGSNVSIRKTWIQS